MPTPKKSIKKKTSKTADTMNTNVSSIAVAELPRRTATRPSIPRTLKVTASPIKVSSPAKPSEPAVEKPVVSKVTEIVAQIDVGLGNRLTIRGQGAGLSWDKAEEMQWSDGAWVWSTKSKEDFEFKVLLNDQVWCQGDNMKASAGQKVVFTPGF